MKHQGDSAISHHNIAMNKMKDLLNLDNNIITGSRGLARQHELDIAANRTRLNASVDAVRFLMNQGLACRGNDESTESLNRGNFIELIKVLCARDGDLDRVAMERAPQNATMTSPDIQKGIIAAHASIVREKLDQLQRDAYYCIMADETRDESKKEQLALLNRFVSMDTGVLHERLVGLYHVRDTGSENLSKTIVDAQESRGRPLVNCRAQCYDGASAMSGSITGMQTRIREIQPHAYFIHCWAHCLQLALVAACKDCVKEIADFFTMISDIINVASGSCKRNDQLRGEQQEAVKIMVSELQLKTGRGLNQATALQRPGDTRWSSYWRSIVRLIEMFDATVTVIDTVENDGSTSDQRAEARRLLDGMCRFKFVFILHLMEKLLGFSHAVSQALQAKDQDITNAMRLVDVCLSHLQRMRDDGYANLLATAKIFSTAHEIELPDMTAVYVRPGRPRRDALTDTNDHVYRVDIFNATIDAMINEIRLRFNSESMTMLRLASAISPRKEFESFQVEQLIKLATEFFPKDFDQCALRHLRQQLENFEVELRTDDLLRNVETLPALSIMLVQSGRASADGGYHLLFRLVSLILTIPVSSATAERVFSALRIIKNRLRSSIGHEFMENAMLLFIEREFAMKVTNEEIMARFQQMGNRRVAIE